MPTGGYTTQQFIYLCDRINMAKLTPTTTPITSSSSSISTTGIATAAATLTPPMGVLEGPAVDRHNKLHMYIGPTNVLWHNLPVADVAETTRSTKDEKGGITIMLHKACFVHLFIHTSINLCIHLSICLIVR